jgi:hypothetical protein
VKKIYKEFVSKAKKQFVKVLNIELIDSCGMRINGALFGDTAK